MATIRFFLQSKKNPATIYVSLSVKAKSVFKRKTGYVIDPNNWSDTTNLPLQNNETLKNLKVELIKLSTSIQEKLNNATKNGIEISGDWLQNQIDIIQGKQEKTDINRLSNYIQEYINNLPFKEFPNGKKGVAHSTIQKYNTLLNKIFDFEKFKKQRFYIKDVDLKFRNELLKYFIEIDKLNSNSAGRYIRFLKTVCLDAKLNGIETHEQLGQIKGYSEKVSKVFLSLEELEKIETKTFKRNALENAKDWLIIGCFIGQRVSDLLILTKDNINIRNGLELLELTQKKTGKRVVIPLHYKVKKILDKRNGEFPVKLSAQKFNKHIKNIAEQVKINQPIEGGKMNPETGRKEFGVFPKHELVSSHVCRRSFASNFYGEIPTSLLINITSHSTEQQFLEYIGKTSNDFAIQLAEYWNKQQLLKQNEPHMKVIKKAK